MTVFLVAALAPDSLFHAVPEGGLLFATVRALLRAV
jgi:hypothetical protein